MYEEMPASIRVKECYLEGAHPDMSEHACRVLSCEPTEDDITLLLLDAELSAISLDSIYHCRIGEEEPVYATLTFYRRYLDKQGHVICARINDGFTKKPKAC